MVSNTMAQWRPECIGCFFEARAYDLYHARRPELTPELVEKIAYLTRYDAVKAFVESYSIVCELLGCEDPYAEHKEELRLKAISAVRGEPESIEEALALSLSGNAVDTAVRGYRFQGFKAQGAVQAARLVDELYSASRVGIVLDNAGEHVYDVVLAKKLKSMGIKVYCYVRSKPYEVDVTISDAVKWGLQRVFDRIVASGTRYPAITSRDVVEELKELDVVIAKGIANLEAALAHIDDLDGVNLYSCLQAKCDVIAEALGTRGAAVVRIKKNEPIVEELRKRLPI